MSSILGLGLDLVELERIDRLHSKHGDVFIRRFCRPEEPRTKEGPGVVQHLGGLFAAKEAVLKALGTGWGQGLGLREVEVVRRSGGAPGVRLHGRAAERASRMGVERIHLSISHEAQYAQAVAILEGTPDGSGR